MSGLGGRGSYPSAARGNNREAPAFPGSMHTDGHLIAAYLAGDEPALERLIAAHRGPLMALLRSRVGPQQAEELHQELWTRVSGSLHRYQDRGRFRPFLYTAARRLIIDQHRRSEVRPRLVSLERERAARQSQLSSLAYAELLQAVEGALGELDPPTAEVVRLRLSEELSFAEIAEVQGVALGTVLSRMHRGVRRLRTSLSDHALPIGA